MGLPDTGVRPILGVEESGGRLEGAVVMGGWAAAVTGGSVRGQRW